MPGWVAELLGKVEECKRRSVLLARLHMMLTFQGEQCGGVLMEDVGGAVLTVLKDVGWCLQEILQQPLM